MDLSWGHYAAVSQQQASCTGRSSSSPRSQPHRRLRRLRFSRPRRVSFPLWIPMNISVQLDYVQGGCGVYCLGILTNMSLTLRHAGKVAAVGPTMQRIGSARPPRQGSGGQGTLLAQAACKRSISPLLPTLLSTLEWHLPSTGNPASHQPLFPIRVFASRLPL
jgi:hypothetical protein